MYIVTDLSTHVLTYRHVLQCVLQRVAVCCSVLQCVAVPVYILIDLSTHVLTYRHVLQRVLQCVAVCCSVLQSVAVLVYILIDVSTHVLTYRHVKILNPMPTLMRWCSAISELQCVAVI